MLDYEQIATEYAKSYSDKSRIYFIEHYLSTMDAGAGKQVPFNLFPRQKVFLQSLAENKASIAIKHRQAGITTISTAWIAAQIAFASKDAPETVLCIANKLEQAYELMDKIRDFLNQIPRWYWGEEYYSDDPNSEKNKKDIFKKNSKAMIELFNGCKVYARAGKPNAARGISAVSILIFDEAAFIEDGVAAYSSAVAATASVPNAKIIMVSTPNGKDELYYKTYKQAIAKENNYTAVEFKWFQDPRYNKNLKWFRKNEEKGDVEWIVEETLDETGTINYDEERWRNLEREGWTPSSPWYTLMCKQFNNDRMKITQELDVSFMGSANNVVPAEVIEMQNVVNVRDPITTLRDPLVPETWFWKPPIDGHRYILACDPSRGDAADRTAIEVIDVDGRDEDGKPIVEQVMEYLGKKLGDEIGQLIFNYARMYNNAFVVVDATGGVGDACPLTLISLGYKNIFYDDTSLKKYTIQDTYSSFSPDPHDRMPGFHMQGNRFPMLSAFAGMLRTNEFKVRSIRVINELETWIFKGETGRMDHMSGSHDDSITCLAMGLFVMQYSFNKLEATKSKDAAILKAYTTVSSSGLYVDKRNRGEELLMDPKNGLPFYNDKIMSKYGKDNTPKGAYMWLFAGTY